MALFNLNNIKRNVQKSAGELKKTVADAAENLPDSVKNINVPDSVKDAALIGQSTIESLVAMGGAAITDQIDKAAKTEQAVKTALEKDRAGEKALSIKDALKLIYCLMAADGTISPEEEEKFEEIGNRLDPEFVSWKDELVEEVPMKGSMLTDEEEYFDLIYGYVSEIIYKAEDAEEGIRAKTLIWDLLVMAFSEGDYSTNEKRLIRFTTNALKVDPAVQLEMEQTLRTITALNEEEKWLKSENRPYAVIEEQVNELKERREIIVGGVNALLAD